MSNNKEKYSTKQNQVIEISFISTEKYKDPFKEVELDVVFTNPNGNRITVPAFWSGKDIWKVRYSSPLEGCHKFITRCSDQNNENLNNSSGVINISEYTGSNKLLKHGSLKVSSNAKYLEHMDGTPFFWLADTWWHGFAKRLKWPEDFKMLTNDRVEKGYSVIQIIAGLYYDSKDFNEFGSNEAGWAWDKDFETINPAYFDLADLKIEWLVEKGLIPCIFAAWGFHLYFRGIEKMKKHWRYIIARWGAYPVVWCIAGEMRMAYNDYINNLEAIKVKKELVEGWQEVARYIRSIDPYKHPMTVHPSPCARIDESYSSRDIFYDQSLFDINMLQTGHHGKSVFDITLRELRKSLLAEPTKPVINGEVLYEGIMGSYWQETQRFLFWTHMLSGAAGHSYGAVGLFGFNTDTKKGWKNIIEWGDYTWKEAYRFKGSYQLGIGKKFLEQFEWQRFEPHPEWVEPGWNEDNVGLPYAAGIPEKVRIIYIPPLYFSDYILALKEIKVLGIEKDIDYIAYYFNPRTGERLKKISVNPSEDGVWYIAGGGIVSHPTMEDWILVLERKK